MITCPPECPPYLRDQYMSFISRPDAVVVETPATVAYKQGRRAYDAGESRESGATMFYGTILFSWQTGWDDAQEEHADETEAEFILPLVAVGGGN